MIKNLFDLDDYDEAFLLNIIFYPKDYLNKYHDDYYFDMRNSPHYNMINKFV